MSKNIFNFETNGHSYRIMPVEGSDSKYIVIRDGRQTRSIRRDELFVGDEVNYNGIINLF